MIVHGVEVERVERIEPEHLPADRLSVVVFGPGHGESILIRLPNGDFGVVDGCGDSGDLGDGNPVLALLDRAGVENLRFVALTHPHEDHVLGLDELIQRFKPACLWWAGAEHPKTFDRYLELLREKRTKAPRADRPPPDKTIEKTLRAVHDQVEEGCALGVGLSDIKLLFVDPERDPRLTIRSVLPSTESVRNALAWLAREAEPRSGVEIEDEDRTDDMEHTEPHHPDVNDVSGALFIEWGAARVLLTGDALIGPGRGRKANRRGWRWVRAHGLGECSIVKVSHHGSKGAHDPELWEALKPRIALVTPYQYARGAMPPRPAMLKTLLGTGAHLGLTGRPAWWDSEDLVGIEPAARVAVPDGPGRAPAARPRGVNNAIAVVLNAAGDAERVIAAGEAGFLSKGSSA